MENNPKVSVIMPLYNVSKYLDKCLNSILNQTYPNIEIIICDDCSQDDSLKKALDYAKKDKRIKVLKNEKNLRSGATRNKCIRESTGKYILIQDADDYSDLTRIEKEVNFLESKPEYAFVSSGIYRFDENGVWGEYNAWSNNPKNKDFLWGLPYVHPATMFRKKVLDEVNGYRVAKDTARTEDFDLYLRLHIKGYYGYNLDEKLLFYNENIDVYMRRKYRYRIDEFKVRLSAYKKLKLMPIGLLFAFKPLIVGLVPRKLQYKLRKKATKKKSDSQIRVLHVISKPHFGGVETMLMNIYRNVDKKKLQFDFTNFTNESGDYEEEIINMGGKIYKINPIRKVGVFNFIKEIKKLVKENNYKIVHSHISINNSLVLLGAFLGGAKIRISHAHTTSSEKPNTFKNRFLIKIMKRTNKIFANKYCACGILAGEFLYGKKLVKKGKVIIIHNAIEVSKFKECFYNKKNIRKDLKFPNNKIIIGHIGRFDGTVKNHDFIFKIIKYLKRNNLLKHYYFVLVGNGEDIKKYKEIANKEAINDSIKFYGTTYDIPKVMSGFDYFILPSLYEGLPVVVVESQAAGIPAIISKNITKEVDLGLNLVNYLGIEQSDIETWVKAFNQEIQVPNYQIIDEKITKNGYNIKKSLEYIYNLYGVDKDE